ncbi:TPA: MFS transporter, partial [Streptococcus agalactiae]
LGNQVQSLEPNFIREMKEGVVVLRQNKGLFALLLLGTLYTFVYMPINALFPLISMEHFNGTPVHISITEISFAFGMLAGGLLLGRLGGFEKHVLLITSSFFIMGTSLAVSGILPPNGFVIFVVCCAIMGLSVPFYSGVQTALFQEKIKPEYLGRVFSLIGSIMSLAMPIGLILSGFFADKIGVNHWFLLSGILIIGIAIVCQMITEVRKLDLK